MKRKTKTKPRARRPKVIDVVDGADVLAHLERTDKAVAALGQLVAQLVEQHGETRRVLNDLVELANAERATEAAQPATPATPARPDPLMQVLLARRPDLAGKLRGCDAHAIMQRGCPACRAALMAQVS